MKRLAWLIPVIAIVTACNDNDRTTLSDAETLNGKVASLTSRTYVIQPNDKGLCDTLHDSTYSISFDESGNRTAYTDNCNSTITYLREYDGHGNVTEETGLDDTGATVSRTLSEYDTNGCLVRHTAFDHNGNTATSEEHDYDTDGNRVHSIYKDATDGTTREYFTEYDKQGRHVRITRTTQNSDLLKDIMSMSGIAATDTTTEILEYEYDRRGNCTKITTAYEDGTHVSTIEYELDRHGTPTRIIYTTEHSENVTDCAYEWDAHHNFTKKTLTFTVDSPDEALFEMMNDMIIVEERIIEYY